MSQNETELETPPVPPVDFDRIDDEDTERREVARKDLDVNCPRCGGASMQEVKRQTGERTVAFWDDDFGGEYATTDSWPTVEVVEECSECGWYHLVMRG